MATCEHKYGAAYADPNQSSGYSRQCGLCGDIVEAAEGDGCDHIWVATENVGFSSGYGTVCTMCGELGEELDKPPTKCDHAGEEFDHRVDATCESRGYDVYKCSLCNEISYQNIVEPLGHSWVAVEDDGFSSGYGYVCSRCGVLGDELSNPDDGTGGDDTGDTGGGTGGDTGDTGGDSGGTSTEDEELLIRKSTLTSIADAIRAKTGENETMKPTEFADKIAGIVSGGGSGNLIPLEITENGAYALGGELKYGYTYTLKNDFAQEELKSIYEEATEKSDDGVYAFLYQLGGVMLGVSLQSAEVGGQIINAYLPYLSDGRTWLTEEAAMFLGTSAGWNETTDGETFTPLSEPPKVTLERNGHWCVDISVMTPLFDVSADGFSEVFVIVKSGGGGEQPQLNAPSLSRSGTTVTITNPSSNGSFVKSYRVYDGSNMISEQTGKTYSISGFGLGEHLLTVEALGDKFITSARSGVLNASKYSVNMTLSNVTASTSPTYAWHGDSLTINLTPASGYALPATITATMGGSTSGVVYDSTNNKITIASVTGDIVIGITAIKPVTLEETPWATIAEYAENGTIADHFKIGDVKNLTITYRNYTSSGTSSYTDITFTFKMEIVDFEHDDLSDGSGKAGVTFVSKNTTYENFNYFSKWTGSSVGMTTWDSSRLCEMLNGIAKDDMPLELSSRIKAVKKTYDDMTVNCEGSYYLWIPSMQEVGATSATETLREHGYKYPGINVTRLYGTESTTTNKYITRNQPQTNNSNEYDKRNMKADGTYIPTMAGKNTIFCFGFCL